MTYEVLRLPTRRKVAYQICDLLEDTDVGHILFTLSHAMHKFVDRVEFNYSMGNGMDVSLFPDASHAYLALVGLQRGLVVFKFDPAENDTVVYTTSESLRSFTQGIAIEWANKDKTYRVHIAIMGQRQSFTVHSDQLLVAVAELGGLPE